MKQKFQITFNALSQILKEAEIKMIRDSAASSTIIITREEGCDDLHGSDKLKVELASVYGECNPHHLCNIDTL